MLQKCVALDPAYTPAYLVLARLATGQATGVLLRHVVRLQPRSPDHLAEYASWLYQNGKSCSIIVIGTICGHDESLCDNKRSRQSELLRHTG